MSGDHFDPLVLQDLLDDRLAPTERARVQAHVDSCQECLRILDDLGRGRALVREGLPAIDAPTDLLGDVRSRLKAASPPAARRSMLGRRRFLAIGAAAAAGVVAAIYFGRSRDWPSEAIDDYRELQAGRRPLEVTTSDPAALEAFFRARLGFQTRVFDLGMMSYRLVGGRVDRVGNQAAAFYVYDGPQNRRLLCEMFVGSVRDLPSSSARREQNGIAFRVYVRDGYTAVFWQEGDVVCVLVSDMPTEDTIALAFAKAMKV